MSEQSGRSEPADQPRSGKPPGAERSRATRAGQPRQSQQRGQPRVDPLGDLQRWLIKSSAKNMRSQFEDQVRRTLGGQRQEKGDVWDVATTEIPPEVGEAPECQWCPICRAARLMRDSGPGLPGLSGAGDAVASAVQDAVRALDTLLGRAAGGTGQDSGRSGQGSGRSGQGSGRSGQESAAGRAATPAASQQDTARPAAGQADSAARPDSLTGEHGPVGWKPGDRLATAGVAGEDPWATATGMAADESTTSETSGSAAGESDGRGHGSSDRS